MPTTLRMPKLGLTMREGTVLRWRCRENDAVKRGETLLVIESEKVEFEVEAPEDGVVRAILVPEGTTVECGALLAILTDTADEPLEVDTLLDEAGGEREEAPKEPPPPKRSRRAAAGRRDGEPTASPRARRLAEREGVALSRVVGTGPGGRITETDVRAALELLGPRVAIGDVRIAYADVPGPEPPVLFLTGFGLDRTAFNRQLAELAGWRRLLAPDPRGTGGSPNPDEGPMTVERLAADVEVLLDALEVESVDLVGSSLGAAVATEVGRRRPERTRRLVLISPPSIRDPRLLSALDGFCRAADAGDPQLRLRVMAPWLFGSSFLADTAALERTLRGVAGAMDAIPGRTLRGQGEALARWLERASAMYTGLRVPTLVIVGSDDVLTPPAHAERAAREIPGARLERLEGTGHAPMVEAPERLHALLREFLDADG